MVSNSRRTAFFFFAIGFALFLLTITNDFFCINKKINHSPNTEEEFSSEISSIKSISAFKELIRSKIIKNNINGIQIPILIDNYVRKKFYHNTSYQSSCENWLLSLLDKAFPQYFFTVSLRVDDIMKNSYAACNQQSIIFQNIVQDYGFEYGSVGISAIDFNHFANAVKFNKRWYFFDPNLEPKYDRSDPDIFDSINAADKEVIGSMYRNKINNNVVSLKHLNADSINLKEVNKFPARMGVFIQNITFFISWYGWIASLFIGLSIIYLNN